MAIRGLLAGLAFVLGGVAACGDDPPEAAPLPDGLGEVEAAFGEDLADLGLRLTERGGVVDPSDGYAESRSGDHLSLYVEPLRGRSTDQYISGILDTARLITPEAFERWSGLESLDICQEPPAAVDASTEPAAYTRFDISRAEGEAIAWADLTLPAFLARASERAGEGLSLYVDASIRETDAFRAALAAAGLDEGRRYSTAKRAPKGKTMPDSGSTQAAISTWSPAAMSPGR